MHSFKDLASKTLDATPTVKYLQRKKASHLWPLNKELSSGLCLYNCVEASIQSLKLSLITKTTFSFVFLPQL